jgi:hypothetical protein
VNPPPLREVVWNRGEFESTPAICGLTYRGKDDSVYSRRNDRYLLIAMVVYWSGGLDKPAPNGLALAEFAEIKLVGVEVAG